MYPIDKQDIETDNREALIYYSKLYLKCLDFSKDSKEKENYENSHKNFIENLYKTDKEYSEKDIENNFNKDLLKKISSCKNLEEKINFLHDFYAKISYNNEMSNLGRKDLYKIQKGQLEFADKEDSRRDYKDALATCKNVGKILSNDKMLEVLMLKSGKNIPLESFKKVVETSFDNHNNNLIEKRNEYMESLIKYEVDIYKTKYINSLENNLKTF